MIGNQKNIQNLLFNYEHTTRTIIKTVKNAAITEKRNRYFPDVNFATASNFARFGLAEEYYDVAIKRIYQTYQQASFSFGFIISGIFASLFFYLNLIEFPLYLH